MNNRAPLLVVILFLLLPLLYVGSYFALVSPPYYIHAHTIDLGGVVMGVETVEWYRFPAPSLKRFYWPLEQLDRSVRPGTWELMDLRHFGGGATHQEIPDAIPAPHESQQPWSPFDLEQ